MAIVKVESFGMSFFAGGGTMLQTCTQCLRLKKQTEFVDKRTAKVRKRCWECRNLRDTNRSGREKRKYSQFKHGAKIRGLVFELSFQEFRAYYGRPCWYCGCKIYTVGLDRIDNFKGYLKDNVIPCCGTCNRMKMDLTAEFFIEHAKRITEKHKG